MSKRIPVPPELEHLIEKREQESDRRQDERPGKSAKQESAGDEPVEPERRRKSDRRRRESDS